MNKPYFLYIIHNSGACLFSHNFKEELGIEIFQKDLFSSFITAISTFSSELNQKLGYSKKYGRLPSIPLNISFEIMIFYKDPLIGALVVEKNDIDDDMKSFLNELLREFLIIYENNLQCWDGSVDVFEAFKNEIKRIYNKMEILSYQIPILLEGYENKSFLSETYTHIIKEINDQQNIEEISQKIGKPVDEVKTMVSNLLWLEIITLSEKVFDDDIFEPKKDLFYLIRSSEMHPNNIVLKVDESELKLLGAIDGFKTVYALSEEFPDVPIHKIKKIISNYLSKGSYIEKVELYPRIIRISDDILNKMTTETLALAYSLENICDGESSLADISKKVGIPIREIKKTLDLLGKHVIYKKKYIK
ncbi:MAG: hypothetical protein ACFFAH_06345 [Promethearchaeota archaeon]